jgi:hypothetical protein
MPYIYCHASPKLHCVRDVLFVILDLRFMTDDAL